jgi:hypothetical protein
VPGPAGSPAPGMPGTPPAVGIAPAPLATRTC